MTQLKLPGKEAMYLIEHFSLLIRIGLQWMGLHGTPIRPLREGQRHHIVACRRRMLATLLSRTWQIWLLHIQLCPALALLLRISTAKPSLMVEFRVSTSLMVIYYDDIC